MKKTEYRVIYIGGGKKIYPSGLKLGKKKSHWIQQTLSREKAGVGISRARKKERKKK